MSRLAVSGLVAGYGSAPAVLDGLELSLAAGEVVALLGPNGVGKTTLLKVLSGLLDSRAGTVALGDTALAKHRPEARLRLGNQQRKRSARRLEMTR